MSAHRPSSALLSLLKLVTSIVTLAVGFRAVSDDDFARVVIAQDFAHAPKLDPSGTSWLPFPFWLNGSVMLVLGRSIDVAVIVAVLSGIAAVLITYVAGVWIMRDRTAAAVGAAIVAVLPWSARLGVSTVPELVTSALTLVAMASIATPNAAKEADPILSRPRRIALGGLALLLATLSRYEPWFVAIGFAAFVLRDAFFARAPRAETETGRPPLSPVAAMVGVTLALLGPLLWLAWNQHAHGSATHFLTRVAAYRDAIDHGSVGSRAFGYVFAIARAEPELLATTAFAVIVVRARSSTRFRQLAAPFGRPVALAIFLMVLLTLSSLSGGAPTHHPERALFVVFMLASLLLGQLIVAAVRDRSLAPSPRMIAVFVVAVAATSFPIRRWVLQSESYANRTAEIDIGAAFGRTTSPGDKALLEVDDYGYFAVLAGSGRPEDLVPDHKIDPAEKEEPASMTELVARARASGYTHVVGRRGNDESPPAGSKPRAENARFIILDVNSK